MQIIVRAQQVTLDTTAAVTSPDNGTNMKDPIAEQLVCERLVMDGCLTVALR
jgi:hypothetical protein